MVEHAILSSVEADFASDADAWCAADTTLVDMFLFTISAVVQGVVCCFCDSLSAVCTTQWASSIGEPRF